LPNPHKFAGLDGPVARTTLGVQEADDFLQGFGVRRVPEESPIAPDLDQILVLELIEVMGQG
jgi:hypothetical protein